MVSCPQSAFHVYVEISRAQDQFILIALLLLQHKLWTIKNRFQKSSIKFPKIKKRNVVKCDRRNERGRRTFSCFPVETNCFFILLPPNASNQTKSEKFYSSWILPMCIKHVKPNKFVLYRSEWSIHGLFMLKFQRPLKQIIRTDSS